MNADYARYSRQVILREVGVNGHRGVVAEPVSAPRCARPGTAGPEVARVACPSAMDGALRRRTR